ncbi:hypothetical protein EWM64_g2806 [Hericium alpestre]|uniref:Uncharacterized protein n=1 Tax=Hericium alpestre TaxID=135208 RepID=A0A4Z0A396_9AGAM|nr:hypothetical protein EWM64_g2806 [Hericium alpestre]
MVFNPKMLDASIRDVVSCLTNEQKADVLLYAMQQLPSGPGMIVENAAQTCLQITSMRPEKTIQARLLRAKARFAAGLRAAAHQDVQAILQIDPTHREAQQLMPHADSVQLRTSSSRNRGQPRFSPEIWREIASYLPRQDLRTLLFIPNELSSVAGQLLFYRLHLQFGTAKGYGDMEDKNEAEEIDRWHARRSADILTHLLSNSVYATAVRTLVISAPVKNEMVFQIAMLANTLVKLTSLQCIRLEMASDAMESILEVIKDTHPRLQGLELQCSFGDPPHIPNLPHLVKFAYNGRIVTQVLRLFISERAPTLRRLFYHHDVKKESLETPMYIDPRNLTCVDLHGFHLTAQFLDTLITQGSGLETLRLSFTAADPPLSPVFRAESSLLPHLREFLLFAKSIAINDPDLFPSVAHFLRRHTAVRVLGLHGEPAQALGFDAAVWSVLPVFKKLRVLSIPVPKDLSPALSAWLVPRSVTSLTFTSLAGESDVYLSQIWPGLPPRIKRLHIPLTLSTASKLEIARNVCDVRVLSFPDGDFAVERDDVGGPRLEAWHFRSLAYYGEEWLRQHGCEDSLHWAVTLPVGW